MGEALCLLKSVLSLILWGETRKGAMQETCMQMPTLPCGGKKKNLHSFKIFFVLYLFSRAFAFLYLLFQHLYI